MGQLQLLNTANYVPLLECTLYDGLPHMQGEVQHNDFLFLHNITHFSVPVHKSLKSIKAIHSNILHYHHPAPPHQYREGVCVLSRA